ncbi:uncharacterized protein Dana_GF21454 [Drosophila ananassae]|uniref:Casein kinase substrate phosphoprotein PP28 domain-containing protein n=1 Tax=Drosophila ananassae TaxID=7217 RepID=B3MSE9_DROAN|nr:28 kDa heat- and acid-stable phosphoprotein [Drosophila ananassae]EDV34704.1 uncharacterized protein Dana_GF21454 [Drosophila ananassae]
MPRGKYVSHKGRSRQFTPADELQQELDRIESDRAVIWNLMDGYSPNGKKSGKDVDTESEDDFPRSKGGSCGVHSLIEISNPNRLAYDKMSLTLALKTEDDTGVKRRPDSKRERLQNQNLLKSSETKADLARLALVRKEREAAAERRLAAKEAAAAASAAGSETSLKRITPKPSVDGQSDTASVGGYQRKSRSARKK